MRLQLHWIALLFVLASGTALACPNDWGDAPAPYPTLNADNGARHLADPAPAGRPLLGAAIDCEANGFPSALATGDDTNQTPDDEDGVVLTTAPLDRGVSESFQVTVGDNPGLLDAWCDFNNDGDWADGGEQIFTSQSLSVGVTVLNTTPPDTMVDGGIYCRFRISAAGGLSPSGAAADGEVEDYFFDSTPVELMRFRVD